MKITFEIENKFEAECMLKAADMANAIGSFYDDCIRSYTKYNFDSQGNELSIEQIQIAEEISQKLHEHFSEFIGLVEM